MIGSRSVGRAAFKPPPLWPEPQYPVRANEFKTSAAERRKEEQRLEENRFFMQRMIKNSSRLRFPPEEKSVKTYFDITEGR